MATGSRPGKEHVAPVFETLSQTAVGCWRGPRCVPTPRTGPSPSVVLTLSK